MPTINAAGYPYQATPTETPNISAGTPFQNIQARPDAFGAGIGGALQGLGKEFEQAGDRLANTVLQRQELFNRVAADEQINSIETEFNKSLYGDPNDPTSKGFMQLTGKNAMEAYPAVRKRMEDIANGARANLQNDQQRLRFDEATRRQRSIIYSEIGRHYDRQFSHYEADVAKGRLELNMGAGARAAAEQDWGGYTAAVQKVANDLEESMVKTGAPREAIQAAQQTALKKLAKEWAENLAEKDPVGATQFVDKNLDVLQDLAPDLKKSFRAKALEQGATEVIGGGLKPRTSGLIRGGAGEKAVNADAASTAQRVAKVWKEEFGFSDAAIIGGIAGGALPESSMTVWGLKGPGGENGLFQFHPGSHLPVFERENPGDTSVEAQARHTGRWIQKHMPDYATMSNKVAATDAFHDRFEAPKLKSHQKPRHQYIPQAEELLGASAPAQTVRGQPTPAGGIVVDGKHYASPRAWRQSVDALEAADPAGLRFTQVRGGDTDQLLKNLPPREAGDPPDEMIPGLLDKMNAAAKNMPKDPPPELWNRVVQKLRKEEGAKWTDEQHTRTRDRQKQAEIDEKWKSEYMTRMTEGSPNFPTTDEVFKNTEMSTEARNSILNTLKVRAQPGPDPRVSANNLADFHRRILLDPGQEGKIYDEKTISNAYNSERQFTYEDYLKALHAFREANNAATVDLKKRIEHVVEAVEGKLRPFKAYDKEVETQGDPDGPLREMRYRNYIEKQVKDYQKTGKNPADLLDPDKPDFVARPAIIQEYSKGAPAMSNQYKDSSKAAPTEFKSLKDVQAALRSGAFGPPESPEAIAKAKAIALERGYVRAPVLPPAAR